METDRRKIERPAGSLSASVENIEIAETPLAFRLVCRMLANIQSGSLRFVLPDGRHVRIVGREDCETEGVIEVRNFNFAMRSLLGGGIGFYESFADGQWSSPNLADVLYIFARNADHVHEALTATPVYRAYKRVKHLMNRNTKSGARRNIAAHYDLGNKFYEAWLDRTMTYSSARYLRAAEDLASAQTNKYALLARSIDLQPGEHVLEIGSGWGGFAEFAAKEFGARVTGLTISPSQLDYAQRRIFKEGLAEKVDFRLMDYRDATGAFDKIASIEMFEAVGKEYWPTYFQKVRDLLKRNGAAGLQIITISDRFFDAYSRSTDFIQQYVFPGGMLPAPKILRSEIEKAGLSWQGAVSFGADYARTLSEWQTRFLAAWDDIIAMGFDERFKRLWQFYLSYSEAGFRASNTDVMQIRVARA